ncbi:MAG: hypothetical protein Q7S39_09305, partial [Ignavibacteria bacterium]|nr:hypothetical protein [Ignavibacteria bacterium]
LRKSGITSVVIGARNEKQLLDNIHTSSWELSKDEMNQLDEISTSARIYPYWYFDIFKKEEMERYFRNLYRKEDKDGI